MKIKYKDIFIIDTRSAELLLEKRKSRVRLKKNIFIDTKGYILYNSSIKLPNHIDAIVISDHHLHTNKNYRRGNSERTAEWLSRITIGFCEGRDR